MTAMPTTSLQDQVAIVTGASSGLGRATAAILAPNGAKVVVNHPPSSASRDKAAAVVAEIEAAGGMAVAIEADVAKEDQVDAMVAKTVRRFGTVHILGANAGIERPSAIQHMSLHDWQAVLDVNLTGAFLTARAVVREFLSRGPAPELWLRPARSCSPAGCTRPFPGPSNATTPPPKPGWRC